MDDRSTSHGRRISEYIRSVSRDPPRDGPEDHPVVPRKLYRVSEIAQHFDVTRQTVHNYATIGLITEETRTPGGQRLFHESVFDRLLLIQRLKSSYRLHEIRRILDAHDAPDPSAAGPSLPAEAEAYLAAPCPDAADAAGARRPDAKAPLPEPHAKGNVVGPDFADHQDHEEETRRRGEP